LDLCPDQIERLKSLVDVVFYDERAKTSEEWLERAKDADIICTGNTGLKQNIYELKNVFISMPLVGVGWIDKNKIKEKNIKVAYVPGCNKDAVAEWIIGMMVNLFRKLPEFINIKYLAVNIFPEQTIGLSNRKVLILGAGNIGNKVGKICQAFDMGIDYFKRGDELLELAKTADVIINCLSQNKETEDLLGKEFFRALKKGAYFISIANTQIFDVDALLEALDNNLAGAAIDPGDITVGDTDNPVYQKMVNHPKILVTPHIAFNTDVAARIANDMMIDNIEASLKGEPINLVR
jgi:phosphoglycerate dehydrogenase-like enzyme